MKISLGQRLLKQEEMSAREYLRRKASRAKRMRQGASLMYSQLKQMRHALRRATHHYTENFQDPEVRTLMEGIAANFNHIDNVYDYFKHRGGVPNSVKRAWKGAEAIKRELAESRGDFRFSGPSY